MGAFLEISFRNLPPSEAIEAAARRRFEPLARQHRLTDATLTIEVPHRQRWSERPFVVHLRLRVPGGVIAVNREDGHPDPYVALDDAFDAARRRLEAHFRGTGAARRAPTLATLRGTIEFPTALARIFSSTLRH